MIKKFLETTAPDALEAAARGAERAGPKKFLETTAPDALETAARGAERAGPAVTPGASVTATVNKLLYRTSEARTALGCGTTRLYELINNGTLEARRLGHRTYITAESLEAFVSSLPPVVTPTMAKTEHDRWSGHRRPRPKPREDEPGPAE
jgi:hypothetical protein